MVRVAGLWPPTRDGPATPPMNSMNGRRPLWPGERRWWRACGKAARIEPGSEAAGEGTVVL